MSQNLLKTKSKKRFLSKKKTFKNVYRLYLSDRVHFLRFPAFSKKFKNILFIFPNLSCKKVI